MSPAPSPSALGPGEEFERIRRIAARLGPRAAPLGDDCALVPPGDGSLVASTDACVEGVHFRREWLAAEEIGWRAAAGALSDLAAAGAAPVGVLAALSLPADAPPAEALMAGVGEAAASVGAVVLGGDLTAGETLVLTITVLGRTARPAGRGGGAPGDGLWVTGSLGGAASAVTFWKAGRAPGEASRRSFARPEPRIRVGRWLVEWGARALIDLSDGLAGDVRHLAAAGGTGADVVLDRLPLHPGVRAASELAGRAPELFAAEGGEDYELLAAMPPAFGSTEAVEAERATGVPLTRVGRLIEGHEVRFLLAGTSYELTGYGHFG